MYRGEERGGAAAMDGQGDRVGEHVGHDRRTGQVRCDGGSTHRRHAGEPLSEEVEESHYTMADSVCAGGTVERTRRTARPRTAGTACSSWPEGVPRDFSLEASKAAIGNTRNGVFFVGRNEVGL